MPPFCNINSKMASSGRLAKVLGNYKRRGGKACRNETRGSMAGLCTQCLVWFISLSGFHSTDCSPFYVLETRNSVIVSDGHGNWARINNDLYCFCDSYRIRTFYDGVLFKFTAGFAIAKIKIIVSLGAILHVFII